MGRAIANAKQPVSELDQLIADMTMEINEAARAADLEEMALASLNPELIESAKLLGLFGLAVDKVGDAAERSLDRARRAAGGGNAEITQRFPDGSGQSGRAAPGPR